MQNWMHNAVTHAKTLWFYFFATILDILRVERILTSREKDVHCVIIACLQLLLPGSIEDNTLCRV